MNKQYQVGSSITLNKKSYRLFLDRVLSDIANKASDEFVIASIDELIFVAKSSDIDPNAKNIGFWYTLFLNKIIDPKSHNICYRLMDKEGDGQFLFMDSDDAYSGAILAHSLSTSLSTEAQYSDLEIDFSQLNKIQLVLTPKQQILKNRKHKRLAVGLSLLIIGTIIGTGEYILYHKARQESQSVGVLSHIHNRISATNRAVKSMTKESNYLNKYLPQMMYLSQYPIWSGSIDFYKEEAVLKSSEELDILAHYQQFNIEQSPAKDSWVLKL